MGRIVWAGRISLALALALSTGVCSPSMAAEFSLTEWKQTVQSEQQIGPLTELYVEFLLEANPISGISFGVHGKNGAPSYYDERLPDVSTAAWANWYEAHVFLRDHLAEIDTEALSREDQIDHHILTYEVELEILDVTRLGAMTNPLTYISGLGTAFSGLILRDYAPLEGRLRSFGARCRATERYLEDTRTALLPPYVQPTGVQKQVAMARLKGMTRENGLFDKSLPDLLAQSDLKKNETRAIQAACDETVEQLSSFTAWFEKTIVPRPDGEWRLGAALYEAKYKLYMDYPLSPAELLAAAEAELDRVHGELVDVARRIHDEYLADAIAAGDVMSSSELTDKQVVQNVFARLAEDRSTSDTLIEDSYALADAIVGFVREQDLLDIPSTSKLRIENIPPHLSGFAVAQIIPAPPFEPELESVWFWDLALLATSESYLKEYNRPALALVYIHEGVPGHFVQLEYSNRFDRITPKVFLNGPMVEGWASYITTQLVDQGFTIYPDQPFGHELQQLVNDKLVLRSLINAIIDIRLHTTDWAEDAAVELMLDKGFQEEGEARGKLTRAKLSSVQLSSYFAGHHAIVELLEDYREMKGTRFSWKDFNEQLVSAGSPPFFALREYMLSQTVH